MDHSDYSEDYIRAILSTVHTIAFVGASAKEVRPSFMAQKYMQQKGYRVIPVNPGLAGQEILGEPVFSSLTDIDEPIDMVDIFRNSEAALAITREALQLTPLPRVIWMQLSVENVEAAKLAEDAGLKVVMNRCPKMEFGKLSGEWGWMGANSGRISAKRGLMTGERVQSLGIARNT
ncbi:MAG: CoA-binding protein [Hyphomicrobiales bacterium]